MVEFGQEFLLQSGIAGFQRQFEECLDVVLPAFGLPPAG
jgi:hypothetical protein